ncbi:MAG: methylated-DNA--[protein]-cysteine S-methyltransferase [Planctomycetota bacterium]
MTETHDHRIAYLFRSPLGWIGVVWEGEALQTLTFGHARREAACRALGEPTWRRQLPLTERQQTLCDRLLAFTEGAPDSFADVEVTLDERTDFQRRVLEACRQIPYGQTASYAELAKAAGRPKAARAVGTTMSKNPVPLVVPCHRVVSSARANVGGFSAPGGVSMKQRLLALEAQLA